MLRYYFDEHVDAAVAKGLRARGIDVIRAQDVGRAGKRFPDTEQLAYATSESRVMVTADRDFILLAHQQTPHAGIIMLQQQLRIGELIDYLELMAQVTESDEMRDQLVYCKWH